MKRARFVAGARREFLAQVAFYEQEEPGLGARFSIGVEDATARAVAYPLSGSPESKNTRRVLVKDFPFSVVYRPTDDGVTVFAVAHTSRHPDYWSPRVQDADELAYVAIATAVAQREAVIITNNGHDDLVLLAADEYARHASACSKGISCMRVYPMKSSTNWGRSESRKKPRSTITNTSRSAA